MFQPFMCALGCLEINLLILWFVSFLVIRKNQFFCLFAVLSSSDDYAFDDVDVFC